MVAAQRVLSNREGLIDDPYAEPLVRAVGLDFFIRALDGEIESRRRRPEFNHATRRRGNGRAHTLLRRVVHRRGRRRRPPGGDPGRRPGRARLPVAVARRHDRLRARPARGHRVQDRDAGRAGRRADGDRRTVAIDLRDDWPKALRDNGFDPTQPDRVDRRGSADLPAAGGAGPAVRQDRRAQRARQPGRHRTHPGRQHVLRRAVADRSPNG